MRSLCLGVMLAVAGIGASLHAEDCGERPLTNSYQLGLSLQVLMPNDLPDFSTSVQTYGLVASVPLGLDSLVFEGQYGSATNFYLSGFELNYRILLPTPFFTPYVLGGGHFMHYALNSIAHDNVGANLGFGLLLPLASNFQVTLGLKGYIEARAIISVGGGFTFNL